MFRDGTVRATKLKDRTFVSDDEIERVSTKGVGDACSS
jgi:hypothetical protein